MAPLKRAKDLLVEQLADELIVYDQARHRCHCLNPLAAFIWHLCDGKTTPEELARRVHAQFADASAIDTVRAALDQLATARLLEGEAPRQPGTTSRRKILKRVAAAALVVSVAAPSA